MVLQRRYRCIQKTVINLTAAEPLLSKTPKFCGVPFASCKISPQALQFKHTEARICHVTMVIDRIILYVNVWL